VTLRVAFDVDGVLADMADTVGRQAAEAFGTDATDRGASGALLGGTSEDATGERSTVHAPERRLTRSEQRRLWKRMRRIDNLWESLDELEPGMVARLWTLTQEHRWEVVFLTSRPDAAGQSVQLQTQRWLQQRGFLMPSVFVVRRSRGKIATALDLDVVIDDRPENCVDVIAESTAKAILISRERDDRIAPSARSLGIGVLGSVAECLDVLMRMDTRSGRTLGILDRLQYLFHLTSPRPPAADHIPPGKPLP